MHAIASFEVIGISTFVYILCVNFSETRSSSSTSYRVLSGCWEQVKHTNCSPGTGVPCPHFEEPTAVTNAAIYLRTTLAVQVQLSTGIVPLHSSQTVAGRQDPRCIEKSDSPAFQLQPKQRQLIQIDVLNPCGELRQQVSTYPESRIPNQRNRTHANSQPLAPRIPNLETSSWVRIQQPPEARETMRRWSTATC